ncbi:MAG: UTP--glucose-1-phosphate uridylyltransferase [Acholeplasmatales bacterium]|nr:MAG: UTP--glucose-1-phosphate uridylyltransferase [Acholeplasmatales bacterium]
MSQPIRKAVIPMAGKGTRFYPLTQTIPKALIALGAKPVITYVLEEALAAGLTEIFLIVGPKHDLIDQYISTLQAHDARFQSVKINTVVQPEPLGLGHAILCAEPHVGREPFVVLLADDVIESTVPVAAQLIAQYKEHHASIIGVQTVSKSAVVRYGMVEGERVAVQLTRVRKLTEKPPLEAVVSQLATLGRYLFTADIFQKIRASRPGAQGEIQISDAIDALAQEQPVYAYQFQGRRYDTGTPEGWREAVLGLLSS